jgi:hypothetical protein
VSRVVCSHSFFSVHKQIYEVDQKCYPGELDGKLGKKRKSTLPLWQKDMDAILSGFTANSSEVNNDSDAGVEEAEEGDEEGDKDEDVDIVC